MLTSFLRLLDFMEPASTVTGRFSTNEPTYQYESGAPTTKTSSGSEHKHTCKDMGAQNVLENSWNDILRSGITSSRVIFISTPSSKMDALFNSLTDLKR